MGNQLAILMTKAYYIHLDLYPLIGAKNKGAIEKVWFTLK